MIPLWMRGGKGALINPLAPNLGGIKMGELRDTLKLPAAFRCTDWCSLALDYTRQDRLSGPITTHTTPRLATRSPLFYYC